LLKWLLGSLQGIFAKRAKSKSAADKATEKAAGSTADSVHTCKADKSTEVMATAIWAFF
jgi:hypothetical protein